MPPSPVTVACNTIEFEMGLTFEALKYFYVNQETEGIFQFEIIVNVLVSSFHPILNTYVMGLRSQ